MNKKRILSLLLLLTAGMLLAGCALNKRPEVVPNQPFAGLSDALLENEGTLNIVFVHGMGHHPFGSDEWSAYQAKIASQLGFRSDWINPHVEWKGDCPEDMGFYKHFGLEEEVRIGIREDAGQVICPLMIGQVIVGYVGWWQYKSPNGNTLNLFELSWDRTTELLQKRLLELDDNYQETLELDSELMPYADGFNRERDRAAVNRWLKRFVNQKLGDPVLYLGAYGRSIRRTVTDGLITIGNVAGKSGTNSYSIISDSLGSRIVFDALGCALKPDKRCKDPDIGKRAYSKRIKKLKPLAQNTTQFFMNANQLPLLALGNVQPPKKGESEEQWLKRFPCEAGAPGVTKFTQGVGKRKQPLQIVAFTDPNDALSYHLTRRYREKCQYLDKEGNLAVEFVNVRLLNTQPFLAIYADPELAHTSGFRTNQKAIDMLVDGYSALPEPKCSKNKFLALFCR